MRLHASDLFYLAPELTIVVAAVLLSILDLLLPKKVNRSLLCLFVLLSILVSGLFVLHFIRQLHDGMEQIVILQQSYRIDQFANLFKLLLLTGTAFVVMMSMGFLRKEGVEHKGEYYYLLLPALTGGMIMASSGDLITLFVGLELLSITSYILVGIRKKHLQANEAAFKYIVLGGAASAFILYGMSFLYGLSGSTNLQEISTALRDMHGSWSGMIYLSFMLILTGLAFKIAAAPFHTWAPDVYEGAATPITAFLSVVSKTAGIAMLFRLIYNGYYGAGSTSNPIYLDLFFVISLLAAAAMVIGNTAALKQRNVKRMLAFSSIANSGYILVPLSLQFGSGHYSNFAETYFFLTAYLFMNIGAFAVLIAVSHSAGHHRLESFSGLYHRSPFTAAAMTIFILSLAGIPITSGFIGKFYILLGSASMKIYWLAAVMILTSVISYFYYFRIIRYMYMRAGDAAVGRLAVPVPLGIVMLVCAAAVILLGLFPQWLLNPLENMFKLIGDLFIL